MQENNNGAGTYPAITPFLVSIDIAAKYLSLSRSYIYQLIDRENLPYHQFGKAKRINLAELVAWLDARKEKGVA